MAANETLSGKGAGAEFRRFGYRTADEFMADLERLSPEIPFSGDMAPLARELAVGGKIVPNRLAVHPMEGADGKDDGSPDELTFRRYRRFASGGAGLLWFEATAVVPEGRANPRQLWLHRENADSYRKLLDESLAAAASAGARRPCTVLQLTHSGRQSRPGQAPAPIIACVNPFLDRHPGRVITDDELERLRDQYVEAAVLAADAGFDAVDVKACHGYLLGELLSAHQRPGKYGGSFENRVRFLLETVEAVHAKLGNRIAVACRFGVWDSIPDGWGISRDEYRQADFSEPMALAQLLRDREVRILDVTCGNPYYNPHVNRPFDQGFYTPPEHPMLGAAKLLAAAKAIQAAVPDVAVIGTGLTWYRQFGANIAAAAVRDGWFSLAGFGRQFFAYPDFPWDILEKGGLDPAKCCIACGNCTVIMRDGGRAGCLVRDREVYAPIYKEGRAGKPAIDMSRVAEHV